MIAISQAGDEKFGRWEFAIKALALKISPVENEQGRRIAMMAALFDLRPLFDLRQDMIRKSMARKWAALLILAASPTMLPSSVMAQQSSRAVQDATKDVQFLAVPEAYLTAQRDFDTTKLSALTDPDFVEISPVGEVDRREKMLSFYTADKKSPAPPMRFERVYAAKNGSSGTIIGKVIYTIAAPSGETRTSELTAAFQLRRTKGRWLLVTAQYTPVRAARPPALSQK